MHSFVSFVQAQHYRDALGSRAIRKFNHKSEMVRIRLRGPETFMKWVVVSLFANITRHSELLEASEYLRGIVITVTSFERLRSFKNILVRVYSVSAATRKAPHARKPDPTHCAGHREVRYISRPRRLP